MEAVPFAMFAPVLADVELLAEAPAGEWLLGKEAPKTAPNGCDPKMFSGLPLPLPMVVDGGGEMTSELDDEELEEDEEDDVDAPLERDGEIELAPAAAAAAAESSKYGK